eukprot:CAMPEP_0195297074 /NCGR_PEP_ID=MMETSP0707-20130614/20763_1 /TAXON_ID=33640 /ORGANISM="Asterionellopsis glacialis, Strain CCMP134" /LENGTH=248 /DNA_ID=CAMNT_0040358767 /DNA_START=496 /DNA_END=1242 /DNA_ORIENTATION=+
MEEPDNNLRRNAKKKNSKMRSGKKNSCSPGAYWRFGKKKLKDSVGGFDGSEKFKVEKANGKLGKGLKFDSWDGSYILIGKNGAGEDINNLYSDGEFSILMWLNREASSNRPSPWEVLLADWSTVPHPWETNAIHFNLYDGKLELHTTGGVEANGESVLSPGTWYHVGVSVKNGRATFYVNGKKDGQGPASNSISIKDSSLKSIGAKGRSYYSFDGVLDEVAMYDCALSKKEVEKIYEKSVAGKPYPNK